MARTIIDSIGVTVELESAPLFRGLEAGDAAIQQFRAKYRSLDPISIPVVVDTSGASADDSLREIGTALQGLDASILQSSAGVAEFFQGFREGAAEAFAELKGRSGDVAEGIGDLAQNSLTTADAFQALGVAEEDLNAALERSGLLSVQVARSRLQEGAASQKAAGQVALLAGQLQQVSGVSSLSARGSRDMIAMFNVAGASAERAAAGSRAWAAGIANVERQQQGLPQVFGKTGAEAEKAFGSTSRLTNSLGSLAAASLGAEGPVSRVALSFLPFLGVGLGVTALLAGIALGYDRLTARARGLREEQERLIGALRQRVESQTDTPADQRRAARLEIARLQAQELLLERQIAAAGFDIAQQVANRILLHKTLNAEKALSGQLSKDEVQAEKSAAEALTRARLDAAASGRQDELAFAQQAIQGQEALLRNQFAQELVTRDQFFQQRLTLAQRAAQAELTVLQQDRIVAATPPAIAESAAEREARRARVEHLDSLIALRNLILDQQRHEIRNEELLAKLSTIQKGIGPVGPPAFLDIPDITLKPKVDLSELDAAVALSQARFAQGLGDDAWQKELDRAADAARNLLELLPGIGLSLKDIGDASKTVGQLSDTFFDVADGIAIIGDAFIRAGQETGVFSDDAVTALQDVQAVAEDAASAIASIASGNVLGAIQSGLNLIGSIGGALGIGESPEEKAREQAAKELKVAIERLTREVGNIDFDISGNTFAGLEDAFAKITDPKRFLLEDNTKLGLRVDRLLGDFGLTIDDVKAAAAEMGIEFANTAEFYKRFAEGLKEIELTRFATTFEGQLQKLLAGFDILGITDPAAQFEELARLASSPEFGAPAIADALRKFNVNLEDGLDEGEISRARDALREVFRGFEGLTKEQLGALSPEQLLEILAKGTGLATDALDEFEDQVGAASRRLGDLSLPQGFRRSRIAFQAGDRGSPFDVPTPPARELGDALPFGTDGAALPLLTDIIGAIEKQEFGPITDALSDQEELLRELVATLSEGSQPRSSGGTAAVRAGEGASLTVQGGLHVHVTVPGGSVTPQVQADVTRAVLAGLREISMNQSGDTLQIPVL